MRRSLAALLLLLATSDSLRAPLPQLKRSTAPGVARAREAVLAAAAAEEGSGQGGASLTASSINLVKAIVGSGVLSLPVGIAAFSSSRRALTPAVALLFLIGAVSAYCFSMVSRVCEGTVSGTFRAAVASHDGHERRRSSSSLPTNQDAARFRRDMERGVVPLGRQGVVVGADRVRRRTLFLGLAPVHNGDRRLVQLDLQGRHSHSRPQRHRTVGSRVSVVLPCSVISCIWDP